LDERIDPYQSIGLHRAGQLRQTITCGVIAAPPNPFDSGAVGSRITRHVAQENHMTTYQIHTVASAPEKSKPALEQLQQVFGVLPNIAAVIGNSPKLVNSLVGVFQQVHSSSLTEPEIQIVLLTDAVVNSSQYAVAFHTALAGQQGVSREETDAIRDGRAPRDRRFAALSTLAKALIEKRGHLSEQERGAFLDAGFTTEQIMEVIAIVAASTITNYAATIANPPLEERFQQFAWRG
jgi:alkylhydroperoxidase family enzyme